MSEHNVELLRRFMEAFNRRDREALITLSDPGIELHSVFAAVGGAVYRGHDGLREYFRDMEDAWGDEIRIEPETYFDLGEQTLVFYLGLGRGRQSGAEVSGPAAAVANWRNGLIVRYKAYLGREGALEELGVSEDALAPIAP